MGNDLASDQPAAKKGRKCRNGQENILKVLCPCGCGANTCCAQSTAQVTASNITSVEATMQPVAVSGSSSPIHFMVCLYNELSSVCASLQQLPTGSCAHVEPAAHRAGCHACNELLVHGAHLFHTCCTLVSHLLHTFGTLFATLIFTLFSHYLAHL